MDGGWVAEKTYKNAIAQVWRVKELGEQILFFHIVERGSFVFFLSSCVFYAGWTMSFWMSYSSSSCRKAGTINSWHPSLEFSSEFSGLYLAHQTCVWSAITSWAILLAQQLGFSHWSSTLFKFAMHVTPVLVADTKHWETSLGLAVVRSCHVSQCLRSTPFYWLIYCLLYHRHF